MVVVVVVAVVAVEVPLMPISASQQQLLSADRRMHLLTAAYIAKTGQDKKSRSEVRKERGKERILFGQIFKAVLKRTTFTAAASTDDDDD